MLRVVEYRYCCASALRLWDVKVHLAEVKSMSTSKFLKELVTGSPERKAAREASRRNPSIYRFVMFVAGFLVCAYTLLEGRGNWLLIVLTVLCAVAAYSEVRKYQKLDQTLSD